VGLQLPKPAYGRSRRSPVAAPRNVVLGVVLGSAVLFLSGCSAQDTGEWKRLAMPVAATKEAHSIHDLWIGAWVAALLTGAVVWGLIFYVVIRYRRRDETDIPVQTRYNLPIEIFYTIAPIMMVIVFFSYTLHAQDKVLHNPKSLELANAQAGATVTVVGQQWSWTFNYTDVDALGGGTVYEGGTPADPPTLWLVMDQSVSIDLYSPDVIHSFWVPAFLFKMDVFPGREKENHFTLTPDRSGTFDGRCAELCGVYHSRMLFNVKVTDQASFDAHMKQLESEGNTGLALGGSFVGDQPGLEGDASNGGQE
jgi:cytochrome c oxidase subunit II